MPDYIAINWEKNQLCGMYADVGKTSVRVSQCFTLEWPEDIDPSEQTQDAGEWLRDELKQLGVSGKQVLVSVPREEATVRHLELPPTPDSELADLVRFQASTKSALPIAQLHLDYLPLPPRAGFAGRDVLMTTMSKARADSIQSVLATAGLELVSLSVGPIAAAELVARVAAKDGRQTSDASLVLGRHENRVEISVVRDNHLLFTHSSQIGDDSGEEQQNLAVMAEVSRSFVALQKTLTDIKIGQAWVWGLEDEIRGLVDNLGKRLDVATIASEGCRVAAIDPLNVAAVRLTAKQVPGNRALYAGPVGMLLSKGEARVETVDFLNPREPEVEPDRRIHQALMITAIVVLVGGSGLFLWWNHLGNLDDQIAALNLKQSDYQKKLDALAPSRELYATLKEEWVDTRVNWLEQVREVTSTIDHTERHYLTKLVFAPGKKGQMLGKITGTGAAKSKSDVNRLYHQIHEGQRWSALAPTSIPPDSGDADYPFKFELNVDLGPQPTDETGKNTAARNANASKTTSLLPKGDRR